MDAVFTINITSPAELVIEEGLAQSLRAQPRSAEMFIGWLSPKSQNHVMVTCILQKSFNSAGIHFCEDPFFIHPDTSQRVNKGAMMGKSRGG